jgi:hypothetical protein
MTNCNVAILDSYRPSKYRISKDTCGGYGTENDFGIGLIPSILSSLAKHSLFWSPLSALNLLSEFKNNKLFNTIFLNDVSKLDNSVDYIFISVSIVCSNHELELI